MPVEFAAYALAQRCRSSKAAHNPGQNFTHCEGVIMKWAEWDEPGVET